METMDPWSSGGAKRRRKTGGVGGDESFDKR